MKFATISGNMEPYQSAYRPQHSMETALLKVKTDILKAMDNREICCLLLLNLSAAFDMISHELLLNRLKYRFGFEDKILTWIKNYFSNREQRVIVQDGCSLQGTSQSTKLHQGLPQGSVLGPILFSLFIFPIGDICLKHNILYHGYADDMQNYLPFKPAIPGDNHRCRTQLEKCIAEIQIWMHTNFLKLNDEKTKYIIIGTYKNLQYVADTDITIADETITASDFMRDLGFWFDKELKGSVHINKITSSCIYTIRNVTRIRHLLDLDTMKTLMQALVLSHMDYCNSLLLGCSDYLLQKLQHVQNMAYRVVCQCTKFKHISPFLADIHWLKVKE